MERGETPVSPRFFPGLSLALIFARAPLSERLEQANGNRSLGPQVFKVLIALFLFVCFLLACLLVFCFLFFLFPVHFPLQVKPDVR